MGNLSREWTPMDANVSRWKSKHSGINLALAFRVALIKNRTSPGEWSAGLRPWREAKLTKVVNDQAFCISTSGRR